MNEAVRALWKYRTGDDAIAVGITADGKYVVGGSDDGYVYFFHRDGRLLWRYKVAEGEVFRLALANGAQRIAVGTTKGKYITVLDYDGQLVWQQLTGAQTWAGAAISADGELVCGGADDGRIRLWNGEGRLLWEFQTDHNFVRPVQMTPDGEYIVAGSDDHHVYMLNRDGDLLWKSKTGGSVWAGARITLNGEYIAAGSLDEQIYLFDRTGYTLWRYKAEDDIGNLAITPDGQYIAAGSTDGHVYLLDQSGRLLWKYRAGNEVYGVAISTDGQFVIAASYDRCAYLFNVEGEVLYKYETQNKAYGVAITPNGRYFAIGSRDHHIYLFENLLAPEEVIGASSAIIEPRLIIQRIRRAYINNPYLGLARWFEEFDRYVARGQCEVCQALLKEVREQGYPFTRQEWAYVDNREGVFLLRQGVAYHQKGEYEQAKTCYDHSLKIQERLKHFASQGQIKMAQDLLRREQSTGKRDPFLEVLPQQLAVLGGSQALLCGRLNGSAVNDYPSIIQAAIQLRLTQPLAQAARSDDPRIRMMAVAALDRFSQLDEDEINVLLASVEDSHWFTRWRAAEAVGQYPKSVQTSISSLSKALEQETDPEVCCALALSLGNLGDHCATPALAQAVEDADPEVRLAAAQALASVGDRRALPALRQITDGKGFLGASIKETAQKAIGAIEKRSPLPKATDFQACRLVTRELGLQVASVYWTDETIYLLATILDATADTRLKLVCADETGVAVFEQESSYAELQSNLETLHSRLQSDGKHTAAATHLVELVDAESPSREKTAGHLEVGMRVRCLKDKASESTGLRVGDTGIVRAVGGNPDIGVEWDRNIGGHNGNLRFKCAQGHGWFVRKNEIEPISNASRGNIPSSSISFSVMPPRADWHTGHYMTSLYIYDSETGNYEHSAEIALTTIAQVKILETSVCLKVDTVNKPQYVTDVIAADTPVIYCVVLLDNAPIGLTVVAELYRSTKQVLERQETRTESEGKQYLAFCWKKDDWEPGNYTIQAHVEDNSIAVNFQVVENATIKDLAMCREIDALQRPLERITDFSSDEQLIYCSVTLSEAPPLTQVVAEWLYLEQQITLIHDCLATLEVPGRQTIAFSLSRPSNGWPLGVYAVRVAALPSQKFTQHDQVGQSSKLYRQLADDSWTVIQFAIR